MGKKNKRKLNENENEFDLPKLKRKTGPQALEKRLIIILEGAQLELVRVDNKYELLNADDHGAIFRKTNRDPGSCRPDITHQTLLMLLDSPLNRAGFLQVYIHTEKNVLIEINPQTRIPRTFKRFAGLMVQLLHQFSVRAVQTSLPLLKVIKNPITNHLPAGTKKYSTSFSGKLVKNCRELVPEDGPIAIVIGAFAHGSVNVDYIEGTISLSNWPMSAALTATKLCTAFEEVWGVI
uniref:18S rRNA (pseudouridine-N1)-methyltransferase n=1 Tax=Tabanus bromius TaxID=304241 RepID=A0A0K8TM91_TABBR